ncbi:MAG: four helix bundle protein [Flavobacteriales bacterium]|nr:four helix bundle protein [Flavobacteriales bacterium]MBK9076267.1 four helix bundle protein [Flavobacteriales bacterium]
MNLDVWNLGMDLAVEVYKVSKEFPKHETYGLQSELRRCCVSIPSKIAEGAQRNNDAEFHLLLGNAAGYAAELITQVVLAKRLGFLNSAERDTLVDKAEHIMNSIFKLQGKLNPKGKIVSDLKVAKKSESKKK